MRGSAIFPWIGAVLLGALVPALIAVVLFDVTVFPPAIAITLGHAAILGLPVALVYRAKRWTQASAAIAGGFMIGTINGALWAWPVELSLRTTGSVGGVPTVIDGIPTLAGWLQYLGLLGALGGLGAAGGLVFWLTLKASGELKAADPR